MVWRTLTEPSARITDLTERHNARLQAGALVIFVPACLALATVKLAAPWPQALHIYLVAACLVVAYALSRSRLVRAGAWLLVASLLIGTWTVALHNPQEHQWPAVISLAVLAATVFVRLVQAAAVALIALVGSVLVYRISGATHDEAATGLLIESVLGGFGLAIAHHRGRLERERRQELQTREAALAEARRHEAIGRLAGGIAHDFNNLLTVILANASLIHRGREARPHAREIESAAQRAAALVRQLLAFSRRQVMTARTVALTTVLAEVEGILGRLLGEDVELAIDAPPDLWPVEIDPTQLEQVVLNLAANARDAMPTGGRLTIALRNASMRRDGETIDAVELRVADTGAGMDPETLSHAFEPFFTTKGVGRGTGLGLASVRGIVEQSGGQVTVASAPGRGTVFTIRLPRARHDAAAMPAPAPAPAPGPAAAPARPASVLLVEDDELVRRAVLAVLDEVGLRVTAVSSAAEARRLFEAAPARFGALIADVVMPGTGGPELAAELRRLRPDLPVVLLSGYSERQVAARGPVGPGVRFVAKPFEAAALIAALHAALEQRPTALSATAPTSAAPPPAR